MSHAWKRFLITKLAGSGLQKGWSSSLGHGGEYISRHDVSRLEMVGHGKHFHPVTAHCSTSPPDVQQYLTVMLHLLAACASILA
jgi:hypothetical protein